jgi:CRP-like cAMP-binding protein/Fe-S-cluster-containing hydrogenase component 2
MTRTLLTTIAPEPAAPCREAPQPNRGPNDVHVTIDGAQVTVERGTTILEAARQAGVRIPVLCHHPNERPVGVCRVCSVDAGEKTLSAACVKPVEDGMVIRTGSTKVKQARQTLLELLLSDHPSPCARQQQTGDCELEALAAAEGLRESRFARGASSRGRDDSSAAISVDHDACILCDRCIRGCNEVKHNLVLGRRGKGYQAGIAFDLNDAMGESSCISCGECMVSCPTGALTNKSVIASALPQGEPLDVRFLKQLPYFEEVSGTFLELNRNSVVLRRFRAGEIICREGEYGSTAFFILEGRAEASLGSSAGNAQKKEQKRGFFRKITGMLSPPTPRPADRRILVPIDACVDLPMHTRAAELGPGNLFGEMTCMSQYPRSATVRAVTDCVMLEMLRNVLEMMLQRNDGMRALLDSNYRSQALEAHLRNTPLFASASEELLEELKERAELTRVLKGQVICRQGTPAESFYLIRTGFVKVSEEHPDSELVLAYLGRGESFGEVALFGGETRTATITALDTVDLVRLRAQDVAEVLRQFPDDRRTLEDAAASLRQQNRKQLERRQPVRIDVPLKDFLTQGLMQANSLLLLDLEKCTRCDACVRACADAHDGVTRLVREGLRFDKYLVATSCRQCRDPLCMVGCPVGSIRRRNSLEVVIEDWCIGCGLCAENCPYGNISMHPYTAMEEDPDAPSGRRAVARRKAASCDLCSGLAEPSCVYACPHDAAHRVDAVSFFGNLAPRTLPDSTVL